jgi:hypothetical protein
MVLADVLLTLERPSNSSGWDHADGRKTASPAWLCGLPSSKAPRSLAQPAEIDGSDISGFVLLPPQGRENRAARHASVPGSQGCNTLLK